MTINDFALERYFAKHEFSAKYMFSSSDCDGFRMDYVLGCANEAERSLWENLTLGYTESCGSPHLREIISSQYSRIGSNDVVVATPGELNFIAMNLLVGKGDHAVVISPSYQSLSEIINSVGAEVSLWQPQKDSWIFDVDELEALIRNNTKLIVINFPLNPTGSYITSSELERIIAIAQKHDIWLFSDEMYRDLILQDGVEPLTPVCDLYSKGISLWGMAKSFGLAGLRIGWMVSQNREFLIKAVSFKDYLSICNSAPSEVLASIALNHKEQFIAPNINKIKSNLALFTKFASNHPLFESFTPPKAGSVAFVPVNCPGTALQFCDSLVETTGIMAIPAEMFGYEGNYLRIGFGREHFSQILEILNKAYNE